MKFSFQLIVTTVFLGVFIIAIIVFSGILSSNNGARNSSDVGGNVVIWGTVPRDNLQEYITNFNISNVEYSVSYQQISPDDLYQNLMLALANGVQPDLLIFPSENFYQIKDKLYATPFQAYSERTFRNTNIDGAQIFMDTNGVYAFPLVVDPLVVYYNKDILVAQNYVNPPRTWTDLMRATPILTKKTSQNIIAQSTIAMGEAANVGHYRDILSALFLQTGNPIMRTDTTTNTLSSALDIAQSAESLQNPVAEALTFYTNFANPTNRSYGWHRGMPDSLDYFLSGKSAFYIGRASELFTIQARNPNLNFDVMELFQPENPIRPITYGSFVGVGVLRQSTNFQAAYTVAGMLSTQQSVDEISKALSLPPARRDLIALEQQNPYVSVFFKAALSAFSWLDPNSVSTKQIFRGMIEDVNSGRNDPASAVTDAARLLRGNQL